MSAVWKWFERLDSAERSEVVRRLKVCIEDLQTHSPLVDLKELIQAFKQDEETLRLRASTVAQVYLSQSADRDYIIIDNDGEL